MVKMLLKDILQERNLTYRKAAELTGVPKSTLQAIAEGKRDPKISTLESIAKGLGIRIEDLFLTDYL